MKKKTYYCMLLGLILLSCNNNTKISESHTGSRTYYPLVGEHYITGQKVLDGMKNIEYTKLNIGDDLVLSGDNKIIRINDNLVFADKRLSLAYLIDIRNNKVKKIGNLSAKVGDYLSIEDINYDNFNDEIQILSNEKGAFMRYDRNGNFKRENKIDFFAFSFANLSKERLAFFMNQDKSEISGYYDVLFTDSEFNVEHKAFSWAKLPQRAYAYAGGFGVSSSSLFAMPYSDSLYKFSDKKILLKYVISFGEKSMPYAFKLNTKVFLQSRLDYSFLENPIMETENYLYIGFNIDRNFRNCIINKKTGKMVDIDELAKVSPLFKALNFSGIDKDDCFYSYIKMEQLFSYLKQNPDYWNVLKTSEPKLYAILKESNAYSNPIIVKTKFSF